MSELKLTKNLISVLLGMYRKGIGTNRIADTMSIHRTTVQKYLKRYGIILRKTSPWKNTYNVNFFKRPNKINSYWAGFLLADGYIRRNRAAVSLKLKKTDHPHLLKFKKAIKFSGEIKKYKKYSYSAIDISGTWFIKDLRKNFGIIPNKTFRLEFPLLSKVNTEHFLRGIMDGDGSVSYVTNKQGKKYITVSFLGYKPIIQKIRDILCSNIIMKRRGKNGKTYIPALIKHKNKKLVYLWFSGRNAMKVLKYLYKNSSDTSRLERKYLRYRHAKDGKYNILIQGKGL
jgi:hypothetical protein